jgi:hypothetical protein
MNRQPPLSRLSTNLTPAAFRKLALSMPGAYEAPHFDRTSFRIRTIFATLTQDGAQGMIAVRPVELAHALIREYPQQFFSYGGWTDKFGSLGVTLKQAEAKLVKKLMVEAAARAAPKAPRRPARPPTASTRRRR